MQSGFSLSQSMMNVTDESALASLLDPASGIPSDVTFDIQDEEGNRLGEVEGGHRNVMALKSTVFKAMFYGPMKEGPTVIIKDTTVSAFRHMVRFLHNVRDDWSNIELKDLLDMADVAERYILSQMKQLVLVKITKIKIVKETVVQSAAMAEKFQHHTDVYEAVMNTCISFLTTFLASPEDLDDFNKFLFEHATSNPTEALVALKLVHKLKVKDLAFSNLAQDDVEKHQNDRISKSIVIAMKIKKSVHSNEDLSQLGTILNELQ